MIWETLKFISCVIGGGVLSVGLALLLHVLLNAAIAFLEGKAAPVGRVERLEEELRDFRRVSTEQGMLVHDRISELERLAREAKRKKK